MPSVRFWMSQCASAACCRPAYGRPLQAIAEGRTRQAKLAAGQVSCRVLSSSSRYCACLTMRCPAPHLAHLQNGIERAPFSIYPTTCTQKYPQASATSGDLFGCQLNRLPRLAGWVRYKRCFSRQLLLRAENSQPHAIADVTGERTRCLRAADLIIRPQKLVL